MRRRSDGASAAISASKGAGCGWSPSTGAARDISTQTTGAWSMPSSGHGCAVGCLSRSSHTHLVLASTLPSAAARHPSPRGMGRGDLQRWGLGAAGQVVRRTTPPVPRPRALGVVRRVLQGARRAVQRVVQSPTAPATVVLLSGDVHCSYVVAMRCARRRILGRRSISSRCPLPERHPTGLVPWPTGRSDGGARPAIRRLSVPIGGRRRAGHHVGARRGSVVRQRRHVDRVPRRRGAGDHRACPRARRRSPGVGAHARAQLSPTG